ncbi:MAG: hypothetical protein RBU27_12520 [Bacteroidota bacterium]|nr:hypothetical protein [Bacteroidota bacterium]
MKPRVDYRLVLVFACGCLCWVQSGAAQVDVVPDSVSCDDPAAKIHHLMRDSTRNAMNATVTTDDAGEWFCAWSERTARGADLYGMFFARGQRSGFTASPLAADVPSSTVDAEDEFASATHLGDRTVLIVWQRRSAGRHSIWARLVTHRVVADGGRVRATALSDPARPSDEALDTLHRRDASRLILGPPFQVSDTDAQAMMPSVIRNAEGKVLIVWQDYRNGNADVYARRYYLATHTVGECTRINDDTARAIQGAPRVAADCPHGFLVFWPDARDDGLWKFYSHRVGLPGARNVLIDSAQRKAMTTLIAGVCLPGDSAMFAWKDYRAGNSNIYRRMADLRTGSFTTAERINDDDGERWQRLASADGDGMGHVAVCWEDYRNTDGNQRGDVYMQAYGRNGIATGPNIRINDRDDRIARKMPLLVMDRSGWMLVLWHQGEEGAYRLHGQWLRHPAQREGANFCLTGATDGGE